ACLLEVHQRADGSVHVPGALRTYLGGRAVVEPRRATSRWATSAWSRPTSTARSSGPTTR
ncbi:MAG: hypothetical protein ACR2F6_12320, partial [Mycobacteriales bacterium]